MSHTTIKIFPNQIKQSGCKHAAELLITIKLRLWNFLTNAWARADRKWKEGTICEERVKGCVVTYF